MTVCTALVMYRFELVAHLCTNTALLCVGCLVCRHNSDKVCVVGMIKCVLLCLLCGTAIRTLRGFVCKQWGVKYVIIFYMCPG